MTDNDSAGTAAEYALMKRGLFERPNHQGYTGIKEDAGRYTEADFHPADAEMGITHVLWDDAPEYAPACFEDLKFKHMEGKLASLRKQLDEAQRERDELNRSIFGLYDTCAKYRAANAQMAAALRKARLDLSEYGEAWTRAMIESVQRDLDAALAGEGSEQ